MTINHEVWPRHHNKKARASVNLVSNKKPAGVLAAFLLPLLLVPSWATAMMELDDAQMGEVTGAGLAFVFDDFSMRMAPTSFIELTGSAPTTSAHGYGWRRGDARYYGLSMTSGSTLGTDWYSSAASGAGCSTGGTLHSNLSCALGVGSGDYGIDAMASVYDPFVLRVFEYEGYNYAGGWLTDPAGGGTSVGQLATHMPTVMEFRGPANSDEWRWAFWGELEIDRLNNNGADGACNKSASGCINGADFLQSQTIILGKPIAEGKIWNRGDDTYTDRPEGPRRAVQRWMHSTNAADPTFGVTYDSALSGDFRFSVRQNSNSPDQLHYVPDFQDTEGMYFRNVDAFFPLGTLHYQALTFSGVSEYDENGNRLAQPVQNGNFAIELTRIPNVPEVYNHFYCGATPESPGCALNSQGAIATPNPDTHGYVRWGDWTNMPGPTSTDNGIYFIGGPDAATATNIGVARIEGMLIQHMKLTSLGAGAN